VEVFRIGIHLGKLFAADVFMQMTYNVVGRLRVHFVDVLSQARTNLLTAKNASKPMMLKLILTLELCIYMDKRRWKCGNRPREGDAMTTSWRPAWFS
jgi:hypothetical protein